MTRSGDCQRIADCNRGGWGDGDTHFGFMSEAGAGGKNFESKWKWNV